MKETKTKILECLGQIYNREGGVISAEIEYMLMLYFNQDTKKVNEILKS